MANNYLPRLIGTLQQYFKVGGSTGFTIKNNAGAAQIRNAGDTAFAGMQSRDVKILGNNASNGVILAAPNSMAANLTLTLPGLDGATGHVIKTNGAGTLYFDNVSSDADISVGTTFSEASTGSQLLAPPANAILTEIRIIVSTAAAGGNPTLSIGTSGTPSQYVLSTENSMKEVAEYIIPMYVSLGSSPQPIIVTIAPDGQTFNGTITLSYTV